MGVTPYYTLEGHLWLIVWGDETGGREVSQEAAVAVLGGMVLASIRVVVEMERCGLRQK